MNSAALLSRLLTSACGCRYRMARSPKNLAIQHFAVSVSLPLELSFLELESSLVLVVGAEEVGSATPLRKRHQWKQSASVTESLLTIFVHIDIVCVCVFFCLLQFRNGQECGKAFRQEPSKFPASTVALDPLWGAGLPVPGSRNQAYASVLQVTKEWTSFVTYSKMIGHGMSMFVLFTA